MTYSIFVQHSDNLPIKLPKGVKRGYGVAGDLSNINIVPKDFTGFCMIDDEGPNSHRLWEPYGADNHLPRLADALLASTMNHADAQAARPHAKWSRYDRGSLDLQELNRPAYPVIHMLDFLNPRMYLDQPGDGFLTLDWAFLNEYRKPIYPVISRRYQASTVPEHCMRLMPKREFIGTLINAMRSSKWVKGFWLWNVTDYHRAASAYSLNPTNGVISEAERREREMMREVFGTTYQTKEEGVPNFALIREHTIEEINSDIALIREAISTVQGTEVRA